MWELDLRASYGKFWNRLSLSIQGHSEMERIEENTSYYPPSKEDG